METRVRNRLTEAQEETISHLIRNIEGLQWSLADKDRRLAELRPKAVFYKTLQERTMADNNAKLALQRFLTMVRLALPDPERGFTQR